MSNYIELISQRGSILRDHINRKLTTTKNNHVLTQSFSKHVFTDGQSFYIYNNVSLLQRVFRKYFGIKTAKYEDFMLL